MNNTNEERAAIVLEKCGISSDNPLSLTVRGISATAIRAAVDQVLPEQEWWLLDSWLEDAQGDTNRTTQVLSLREIAIVQMNSRSKLLAIADALENSTMEICDSTESFLSSGEENITE